MNVLLVSMKLRKSFTYSNTKDVLKFLAHMQRTLIYLEKNISPAICGHLIWRRLYAGFCLIVCYIDGL